MAAKRVPPSLAAPRGAHPGATPHVLAAATEYGRIAALAANGQRDLARIAARFPRLFPPKPFDPAMLGTIALAGAYSAPWLGKAQAHLRDLASLFVFGIDWQIERVAPADVDALVQRCLAVAEGGPADPDDDIAGTLALIRTELAAAAPAFTQIHPVWTDAVRRMLAAMARERIWTAGRAGGALPTAHAYLDNAESIGCSMVFTTVWVAQAGEPAEFGPELSAALDATQRLLRLVNDVGSYQRDVSWDDLNALMLGMTRAEVDEHIEVSTLTTLALLRRLGTREPRWASYLERQIGFVMGMYGIGDFWGQR